MTNQQAKGIVPRVDDPCSGPYWAAAAEGRLVVQRCLTCEALRWPPLSGCPECLGRQTSWVEVAQTGTVWSYVVYHRAFQSALADDIPYTVVMVLLDDGPYMVGRVVDERQPVSIGDRVAAEFVTIDDLTSVRWRTA